jgi:pimeloyl-ACP methyl ester carboxylesterase
MGSLVKPEDLPIVKKSLKKGKMVQIKNVGHSIHLESSDAFNQAVKGFLSQVN